ncbi:MAG: YHS domain-containing protein [Dokdonella sp.]|uniref:heavy metal-binding domain-containing protein n=1 Tax=Dokdonella sp. TaxID=2291710 RepID=UPI0025BEBF58|nr:heavy metal-binding domain-containing protein [Dokdonella sp.]MBK8122210.1 YHS domain-containing protein [Dokdonella sp.]
MSQEKHSHPSPTSNASNPACCAIKNSGAANSRIDPVCRMTVDPATASHHLEHAREDHYFCSARCLEKFTADPDKYLHTGTTLVEVDASVDAIYTCPMHPEIRQTGPGSCPICGMALEPEMPRLDEEENPELRDFSRRCWRSLKTDHLCSLKIDQG